MDKQADIIIHGRVQKAGFRDFIDEMAFNLALNGYVKNLDDGTVHVICEGEEPKIKEFVEKININQYPIRVEKIDIKYKSPTHKFKTFEIIRDEDISTATYDRMDAAARYMREMNTNLSQKIVGFGDILGQKIDQSRIEITSEIHSQRDDLKAHFDERLTKMESELIEIKTRVDTIQYISPSKISSKTEAQKAR
ncbi:MAG: acylphosphatase [Candidatus Methanoperedens sp.]|nr:acylphosphatase [Candidatus Methanoperedens sp.]